MKAAIRTVIGFIAGAALAFVLVMAVEVFGSIVHPLPEGFEHTHEAMCQHVERFPAWVLAVAIPMWAAAAFAGVWLAQRIGTLAASSALGILLIAAVGFNISMLPYPIWFKAGSLVAVTVAVVVANRSARIRKPSTPTDVAAL